MRNPSAEGLHWETSITPPPLSSGRPVVEGGAGELNEAQRDHLQNVVREVNELVAVTDALTFVSRFEALPPELVNVSDLVKESVGSAETSLTGQRLVLGPEPAAPVLLVGDRDELKRALEAILRGFATSTEPREAIHIDFEGANQGKRFSIRIHQGDDGAAGSGVEWKCRLRNGQLYPPRGT